METAVGLLWLSRIAVLTIVLALAFFFKYAFENHWITEWGRILLGIGSGVAAAAAGEWFWRSGQRTYAQAFTAAGIAFLYLSCWAAFGLYHLMAQPAALTSMIVVTAAAGGLAVRYDSSGVAILGLIGGFATPLLLGQSQDPWFVFGYALVLDLGAAFASRARQWRWLEAIALAGTMVLYVSQTPAAPEHRSVYTIFIALWYVLFAATRFALVFIAAQLLAGMAVVGIWDNPDATVTAAALIAAAGLAVADRRGWPAAVSAAFGGFWLAYGASGLGAATRPHGLALLVVTAAYLMFLGWSVWRAKWREQKLRLQDLLVMALNAVFYFGAGYGLLRFEFSAWQGLFAVAVACVQMAASYILWPHDSRGSLLAAGAAWLLLVLAAPIQFAGYRITMAWAIEGAALAWIGVRMRDRRPIAAAFAVFLLVLLRLAALDSRMYAGAASYALLVNARFLTFAIAAGCLWVVAWWIEERRQKGAAYFAGHAVMLWGLCLEVAGWAARTSDPSDIRSVSSTSISVLIAFYAVLMVAAGVAWRSAATRIAGIGLIGLVVIKLYLYDVWLLPQFYRMAAFAILGVLLLAMSYLYSRYRGSIESWWRP